jgi:hypothetical protein
MKIHKCIKFITKINGKRAWNVCYALVIGYLKSRLMNLI